jgi:hypothetical protein
VIVSVVADAVQRSFPVSSPRASSSAPRHTVRIIRRDSLIACHRDPSPASAVVTYCTPVCHQNTKTSRGGCHSRGIYTPSPLGRDYRSNALSPSFLRCFQVTGRLIRESESVGTERIPNRLSRVVRKSEISVIARIEDSRTAVCPHTTRQYPKRQSVTATLPAVHQSDTVGLPVPERTGNPRPLRI